MAAGSADEAANFSTAVRGYDRGTVERAISREADLVAKLHERAAHLERELAALQVATALPDRRHLVRRVVDSMTDSWADAARITLDAEYAAGRERAHAEGEVAARRALAQEQIDLAEATAQADADRLVAAAREQASRLLAHADEQMDRARAAAPKTIEAAAERAHEVTRQMSEAVTSLEHRVTKELTERQEGADRNLAVAEAMLRKAKKDAAFIDEQAQAQREAILVQARAEALALSRPSSGEVARLTEETDRAVAELAQLMISAGGQLNDSRASLPAPSASLEVPARAEVGPATP